MTASRTVDLGDVQIVTTDRELHGGGVPVLLMHGNPDGRHSWESMLEHVDVPCRVIAPDAPGFGDSPEPTETFSFLPEFQADLWQRFADAVDLGEPTVVVVHDFGGPWLLPWVAQHPQHVRALLLTNTIFQADYRWHFWARVWQTPLLGELILALGPRWLWRREMRQGSPQLPQAYIDHAYRQIQRPSMRRSVLRTYRAFKSMKSAVGPWEERLLKAVRHYPKRVIWGDLDPYIGPHIAERYGASVDHWPEVGHWTYLERPREFAGVLGQLIQSLR